MTTEPFALITDVIRRAPEWVRHDLLAKESAGRQRAEEALAAMIVAAIQNAPDTSL